MRTKGRVLGATALAAIAVVLLTSTSAGSYERRQDRLDDAAPPFALSEDCVLQYWDLCSCYVWLFEDQEHAVWGTVFDPVDCAGGCQTGGAVKEIMLFTRCEVPPVTIGGIRIQSVDSENCPTALLYESGPIDIVHCTLGDRWTTIPVPLVHVGGEPFVVQVEWGPTGSLELIGENALQNLFCWRTGWACGGEPACWDWEVPAQRSYIYVTDLDGNGRLEDLCRLYGAPNPIAFPYYLPYGHLPNNLVMLAGMDCEQPTATEATSWGRIRRLFK